MRHGIQFTTQLKQYSNWIIVVIISALFAFAAWQVYSVTNFEPDQQALRQRQRQQETQSLDISEGLVDTIQNLREVNVDVDPENVGTPNPFKP